MSGMADLGWLLAPAAALILGALTLAPLGQQVFRRRMIFLDLALAQLSACGALAAGCWLEHPPQWVTGGAAATAALLGAALASHIGRMPAGQREPRVGLLYVAGAAAAIVLAAADPHGREHLLKLLAGDVLWVRGDTLVPLAVAAAALSATAGSGLLGKDRVFYPLFAVVLSVAVPLLGLYLVFALLVTPALWWSRGCPLSAAAAAAALAAVAGLGISVATDWPSSATVTLMLAVGGLMSRARRRRCLQ